MTKFWTPPNWNHWQMINQNAEQITLSVFNSVVNIVGKGEDAGNQPLFLFPQCFQNLYKDHLKFRVCGIRLNKHLNHNTFKSVHLTLSLTTNFRLFQTERKEKLLVMSNFSFSQSVFKRLVLQIRKNQGLFGKGVRVIKGQHFMKMSQEFKKKANKLTSGSKVTIHTESTTACAASYKGRHLPISYFIWNKQPWSWVLSKLKAFAANNLNAFPQCFLSFQRKIRLSLEG